MKNLDKYIGLAYNEIDKIESAKKHVSFILRKNKILSMGVNTFKTHPLLIEYGYKLLSTHSELAARLKIKDSLLLNKATLVNVRMSTLSSDNDFVLRSSKPCVNCMGWIVDSGIKDIYYTTGYSKEFHHLKL